MRYYEFQENYVGNHHQGAGHERVQDQKIMEKPRTRKTRNKRLKDNIGYNIGMGGPHGGQWANTRI